MPWYLYIALRQLFPKGRRWPSFFFFISVLGVTLGVMVLVIVQSVMSGFGRMHRDKMILTSGHIDVQAGRSILREPEKVIETILSDSAVAGVTPYAKGIVMLTYRQQAQFPFIFGIDFSLEDQALPISELLISGKFDDLDDESVLLSSTMATRMGAYIGATVEVLTPLMVERLKEDEVLLPRELTVAGIYESGWAPVDSNTMVTTLRLMQDLYDLGKGIHGVSVRLKEDDDKLVFATAERLFETLPPPATVLTWMDLNRDFLWILALEKNMMLFLLLFIVIVASFAIAVAQLMIVMRKTREIGLLGALGAKPRQIAFGYCLQGFAIGLLGSVLGSAAGVFFLHFRDPMVETLARITQSREALVHYYQFSQLPVYYDPKNFVIIITATLAIATLAGLIPAIRAAMMRPAQALRSE